MTKTRTTIVLPTNLLKQIKHSAIESNLTLSDYMARILKEAKQSSYEPVEKKDDLIKTRIDEINKAAGVLKLGSGMTPEQLKQFIEKSYDEEMLS